MEPLDLTEIGRYTKSLFVDMTSDLHSPPDQVIGLDRSIGHIQGDHAPGRVAVEVRRRRGAQPSPIARMSEENIHTDPRSRPADGVKPCRHGRIVKDRIVDRYLLFSNIWFTRKREADEKNL
jgi:hypothetical protein